MSNQSAADAVFDALGDPMRRRIVERLRGGPMPVGTLAEALPVGRPAVSKHLRVLEGAGLVEHQSVGTRNLYALAPAGLASLQQWLVTTWDTTLSAFAAHVAARAETAIPERRTETPERRAETPERRAETPERRTESARPLRRAGIPPESTVDERAS